MPYLYAITVCCWLYLLLMGQAVKGRMNRDVPPGWYLVQTLLLMTGMLLTGAPVAWAMLEAVDMTHGRPIALGGGMWSMLWTGCIGAGVGVGIFGRRLLLQRKQHSLTVRAVGANVMGTILSTYIVFVMIDQLQIAADRKRSGFLNVAVMKEEGGA